ncbi:MAG: hypothetical protein F6K31_01330 [Symploca sp. SIO2G7]|nr:hypothetical protein [Symploca sp. SIO2G7]
MSKKSSLSTALLLGGVGGGFLPCLIFSEILKTYPCEISPSPHLPISPSGASGASLDNDTFTLTCQPIVIARL